jgi:hypothetical protein
VLTYAEQVGRKCPSRLETEIDVGGVHKSTAAKTDEQRTDGEDVLSLGGQVVERLERVESEVIVVLEIQRLDALDFEVLFVVGGVRVCRRVECVFLFRVCGAGRGQFCHRTGAQRATHTMGFT